MPNFSYRALGRDGKEVRGVLQAENETAAAARIRDNYPVLLSISKQAEKRKAVNLLEMEIGSKKIKTKTLSILCSQFAITLRSGMSVSRAMQMLAGQCGDKRLRKIMEEAGQEVSAGSTVAAALEQYSERFPLTFIETIRAGEQSGTLDKSFDRLHKFYDKAYKTTEKVKGALTYPMFVIAIAIVVVIIVMAKVIPTLADVFSAQVGKDIGQCLFRPGRTASAHDTDAHRYLGFLCKMVDFDTGCAGIAESCEQHLRQNRDRQDPESKTCLIHSACRTCQPNERSSPVCQHDVGTSGSRHHPGPGH